MPERHPAVRKLMGTSAEHGSDGGRVAHGLQRAGELEQRFGAMVGTHFPSRIGGAAPVL
jgi:hypothetical protein